MINQQPNLSEENNFKTIINAQKGPLSSSDPQDEGKNIKQQKAFQMFKKISHERYQQNHKLPSVNKMIRIISNSESKNKHTQKFSHLNNFLNNSINSIASNQSNRSKRLKNISKLVSLQNHTSFRKRQQIEQQKGTEIYSNIYDLMDEIQNTKNAKSFYSQAHFTKSTNSEKKINKKSLQNKQKIKKPLLQHSFIPKTYRTLQNQSNNAEKKSALQQNHQTNQNEKQKIFMYDTKIIRERNKPKQSLMFFYQTIDPNVQTNKKQNNQKNNFLFQDNKKQSKLFQKQSTKHETQKIFTKRQNNHNLQNEYKRKQKQYFHISINRKSLSLSLKDPKKNQIDQFLPQIKVYGKYK